MKVLGKQTSVNSNGTSAEFPKYIIDAIKLHIKAIKFSEYLQLTHDKCFMYTFIMFMGGCALAMVELFTSMDDISNVIRVNLLFTGVFIHLFSLTWPGQSLIDASHDLRNAIYFSEWYHLPNKQAKTLLRFVMLRCTKPCKLTAGPLMELNMEQCGKVIKTAASFFTVAVSFI